MTPFATFWALLAFWTIVNAFRVVSGLFCPHLLHRLQRQCGISVGVLSITWHTTCFNQLLNAFSPKHTLGKCPYTWYCRYFTAGVWLTLIMFPYALFIIIKSVIVSFDVSGHLTRLFSSSDFESEAQNEASKSVINSGFMIVIPGVSIPFHECLYFVLAVAISSFIHELGHALAANRHRMKIENVGISLFICLPVTFVSMQSTDESKQTLFGRLEIVSAGLLNNAVLCLITLIGFVFNPLALLYIPANGLIVSHVDKFSSIANGPNALLPYDLIKSINGHGIHSLDDWNAQLSAIASHQSGFCIPQEFIHKHESTISSLCNIEQCCVDDSRNLCFVMHLLDKDSFRDEDRACKADKYLQQSNLKYSLNSSEFETDSSTKYRSICLPARKVTEVATQFCSSTANCMATFFGKHSCVWPYSSQHLTRLIVLEVDKKESTILFWGPTAELYQAVSVSAIKPRLSILPLTAYEQLNVFYRYLFSISFSLILFNLLPYDPFDGYHIFSISSLLMFGTSRESARQRMLKCANLLSTILVLSCILVGIVQLRQFVQHKT